MDDMRTPYDKLKERVAGRKGDQVYYAGIDLQLKEPTWTRKAVRCLSCQDTGYRTVWTETGVKRQDCEHCAVDRALAAAASAEEARRRYAGLPAGRFQKATFDTFSSINASTVQAWVIARNFAERAGGASRPWLFMVSPPGTGKSHLAAAIVNYRIHHRELPAAKWLSVPKWLDDIQGGYGNGTADETLTMALDAPCLILDDLGAEYHRTRGDEAQDWAAGRVYRVLNHRWEAELETVITSNQPINKFSARVADRMSDVGTELVQQVYIDAPSYRTGG